MDRQEQRATGGRMIAQRGADLPRLAQIQAIERLVAEQDRMRRQHSDCEHGALALPFRQRAEPRGEERRQIEPLDDLFPAIRRALEEADGEVQRPVDRLRGPGRDRIGNVEDLRRARASPQGMTVKLDAARFVRQNAREALEQRRLSGAIRTDEAEHLPGTNRQGHIAQRDQPSVGFRETDNLQHRHDPIDRVYRRRGGYYQPS